jgi:hypothetical protein
MTIARNPQTRANALTPPIDRPVRIGILMTNDTPRTECPVCHLLQRQVGAHGVGHCELGLGGLGTSGLFGEECFSCDGAFRWRIGRNDERRRIYGAAGRCVGGFAGALLNAAFCPVKETVSDASFQAGAPRQDFGLDLLGSACSATSGAGVALRRVRTGGEAAHVAAFQRPSAPQDVAVSCSVEIASGGCRQEGASCQEKRNEIGFA